MKTAFVCLLIFILNALTAISANAQTPAWQWAVNNNLPVRNQQTIITEANGNIYVGGHDSIGYTITKHTPSGNLIWTKNYPGGVRNFSADKAGNLYLIGGNWINLFTAKLDTSGTILWAKMIQVRILPNDLLSAQLYAGASDSAGNTYMSGSFDQRPFFDTIAINNSSPFNFFFAKFNTSGKIQWLKLDNFSAPFAITPGPQGSYFVMNDNAIYKYDSGDSLVWQQLLQASGHFYPLKFLADAQGNLYMAGSMRYNSTFGSTALPMTGSSCMFLAKYNSDGTFAWARTNQNLTATGEFDCNGISLNSSGQILMTGTFKGDAILDTALPTLTAGLQDKNMFIAAFSAATGKANWVKQTGNAGTDEGEAIYSLPNNEYLTAGNYSTGCAFDSIQLPGAGFFLAKLSGGTTNPSDPSTEPNPEPTHETPEEPTFYPNPGHSEIRINMPEFANAQVLGYNTAGQLIYSGILSEKGKAEIKVTAWAAGFYLVKMVGRERTIIQKFLVTH
jgi:hypothetical protein